MQIRNSNQKEKSAFLSASACRETKLVPSHQVHGGSTSSEVTIEFKSSAHTDKLSQNYMDRDE